MKQISIQPQLLKGHEQFCYDGENHGITMLDFWQFQFSNIWDLQEHIAEFLVAKALKIEKPYNRSGWTPFDILYKEKRIEVKESGYFYSWQKEGKTSNRRTFGIPQTYTRDKDGNLVLNSDGTYKKERQNDVYVFCLNKGKTKKESNPLELANWKFYVVSTKVINEVCGTNKTISLTKVRKFSACTTFDQLQVEIDRALDSLPR